MSEKIRETEVERDADGRVVEKVYVERPRKKGGFGWGMLLGVLIVAGAIIAFAYSQGSFQTAGVQADQATEVAQVQAGAAIENTGDALETAGDNAEQAANQASDTVTN